MQTVLYVIYEHLFPSQVGIVFLSQSNDFFRCRVHIVSGDDEGGNKLILTPPKTLDSPHKLISPALRAPLPGSRWLHAKMLLLFLWFIKRVDVDDIRAPKSKQKNAGS